MTEDTTARRTTLLIVLDGFGYAEPAPDNAISVARTPVWDRLWRDAPHTLISGSGLDVGLPSGQMGNSEVGHMNLGAGRVVYQELTRINRDLASGALASNPQLVGAVDAAIARGGAVHLLGLLSPGGVHSHEDHIAAMVEVAAARGAPRVFVHAFLDGRDTPPRSARPSLEALDARLHRLGVGRIASVIGRYFAMDRDERWDRVQQAYDLLTLGDAHRQAASAEEALDAAYAAGESDEFVQATAIHAAGEAPATIVDGDAVVFMNFRADRARELSRAFVAEDFEGFPRRARPRLARFVTLTHYADDIDAPCAYAPDGLEDTLGEYVSSLGRTQLRIAETEKYAHVTFFFNGGREAPFPGEERILVPSPKVATYDLKPEMSAPEVTDRLVEAIRSRRYDLIVCNYANGDMVGHTGVFAAAVKAVETLDACLGRIVEALTETGGQCLITADHGNVEQMSDAHTGQAHTAHTCEPVPLVYVGPRSIQLAEGGGTLADVAPTLLQLMDLPQPEAMTGHALAEIRS
ncbi:MAG: 2,3-bisphosphoglycerate-independent phosphoglycerate mutase [Pseudomonadales bacterium]|jgi:2,3-bisphosphoglycerate-independent phosphoglycerate mutase|nr:2,3-bisphosphoglycerate-independent phosphoglycerate mutase [Pseudomonadales bacterium]